MTKDIVILHGWGSGAKSFAAFADALTEKGYTVHRFDFPGFGEAEPPAEPWAVDDYVAFAKHFCDSKKLSRFFLIGHSFGGRVGIKFAAQYPERVAGLVLYAAAGIKPKPSMKHTLFLAAAKTGGCFFDLPGLRNAEDVMKKILYRLAGVRDYNAAKGVMKDTMKKVIAEDLTPVLGSITVPTLLVWGDNDTMTPVSDAYVMRDHIKGAELEVVAGATHISLHKTEPEKLAGLVVPFLSRYENEANIGS